MVYTGIYRGTDVRQHTRAANHNHYLEGIVIMTDAHSIAQPSEPEVSPANNRQLTVGYASRYPDSRYHHERAMAGSRRFCHGYSSRGKGNGRLYCADRPAGERTDAVAAPGVQTVGAETKAGSGVYSGHIR